MNKILIVDDESHIRLLIKHSLEELEDIGVELLMAENGKTAYNIIKIHRPQLVFLDVMMPEMNGFELCAKIKNELNYKDTYIILLTAKGQEIDREAGLNCGADEYITKPFDPDEICRKSFKILNIEH